MSDESSSAEQQGSTGAIRGVAEVLEQALSLPEPPGSRWHRAGVSHGIERVLNVAGGVVLLLFATGWMWSILKARAAERDIGIRAQEQELAPSATARIASALTDPDARSTAYLMDATLDLFAGYRGESGKLRAAVQPSSTAIEPDTMPPGAHVRYSASGEVSSDTEAEPSGAGIWRLALALGSVVRPVTDFNLITLVPFSAKRRGKVGLYYIGNWPGESGGRVGPRQAPPGRYSTPAGFIEVTPQNENTRVSQHFRLRDFLTHGQTSVWPKYLVLQLRLVDKLELVLTDLQERGIDVSGVRVMSGFRTPQYNAGGGNTAGRADLSRHMYGDAADIFIDSDGDGQMDDLNRDGRINSRDAAVMRDAVDRVEKEYPDLIGGAGVYPAASGHGPFIHIDTRGYRARW